MLELVGYIIVAIIVGFIALAVATGALLVFGALAALFTGLVETFKKNH